MNILKGIGEYLDMVKNGIRNGDKIIEAIRISAQIKEQKEREGLGELIEVTSIVVSDEAIAEIMRRKELCASCPFNSKIAEQERNYSSSLPFEHCTLCKCRIGYEDSKEYCLQCECGMAEWNKRNPEKKQMVLKWEAFKQPENKN